MAVRSIYAVFALCFCAAAPALTGCHAVRVAGPVVVTPMPGPVNDGTPRELSKTVLPAYRVEPPDILVIDAIHVIPKAPYHLRTSDVISIQVQGTLPDAPIVGQYPIEPGGFVNLGLPYGTLQIAGKTLDEAKLAIEEKLAETLRQPLVSIALFEMAGRQQIAGEHLVAPDGTVTLGSYGSVSVVGLTVAEVKEAVQQHLAQTLDSPEVSVDVYSYNSKVYYVISEGAGLGDTVTRFPITGNETVLDAISNVAGLESVSSKRIWIARPTSDPGRVQVLPVDWQAISAHASPATNYQLMPGDRLFIAQDKLVAFDTSLGKILAPVERVMGFTLLGTGAVTRLSGRVLRGGGQQGNGFGGGGF